MANPILRYIRFVFDRAAANKAERDAKQSLGIIGTGVAKLKQGLKEFGAAFAAVFSVRAVGRFFSGAIRQFSEFDQAMTRSLAIMSDVDDAMRVRMVAAARKVSEELNLSAASVAEAYFFLASAGLDAEQSIAALPVVARFAKAGNFDLATATDLLTDAQSALGLTIKNDVVKNMQEMTHVSDVLAGANNLANASVRQFSEALTNKAGAALRQINKDVEEGVAVLAAYADQGLKGAAAGEALNIVLRELQRATRENKDEFKRYGISVFDAEGNIRNMADIIGELERALSPMSAEMQGATLATLGFTERSISNLRTLLGTSEKIREYEAALRSAAGTTESVSNKQLRALAERWGKVKQQVANATAAFGEALVEALNLEQNLPRIGAVVKAFADHVERLVSLLGSLIKAGILVGVVRGLLALRTAAIAAGGGVVVLAGGIRSLFAAIGPTGWAILGLTTLIELFKGAGRAAEEAGRKAADALVAFKQELQGVTEAALDTQTAQLEAELAALEQKRDAIRNAPAREGGFRGGGIPVDAAKRARELAAIQAQIDEKVDRLNAARRERNRRTFDAAHPTPEDPTGPPEPTFTPTASSEGDGKAKEDPVKEALERYAVQVKTIATLSALLGDEFDATTAKTGALTQVMAALAAEGIGPTDERMREFAADLLALAEHEDKVGQVIAHHTERMHQNTQAALLLGESYNALEGEARHLSDTVNQLLELGLNADDPRLVAYVERLREIQRAIQGTADVMADAKLIGQEFAGVIGAALGTGLGPYAKAKAKQNALESAELAAQALVASFNPLSVGKVPQLLAGAATHAKLAIAWGALSASLGGGGGGGGGGGASLATARGASGGASRRADVKDQEVHIHLVGPGFDALQPQVQKVVYGAMQQARERYGANTRVSIERQPR